MQLDRSTLANEAFQESVDLYRLHQEMIEAVIYQLYCTRSSAGWIVNEDTLLLIERVRSSRYEDLSNGAWKDIVGFPDDGRQDHISRIESLINSAGRYTRIDSAQDISILEATHSILGNEYPFPVLLHCLAETAVGQTFDRTGVQNREHRSISDSMDNTVLQEQVTITKMVYDRIVELMNGKM